MDMFDVIKPRITSGKKAIVSVAVAADEDVLNAVRMAVEANLVEAILVGNKNAILELAEEMSFDLRMCTLVDEVDPVLACEKAVKLVSSKQADFLMKGLVDTSILLKAVLNKEWGLRTDHVLSHVAVFSMPHEDRFYAITDGAMNIAPDLEQKRQIIENAVGVMHKLGIEKPNVAVLAAIEKVNPKMACTQDAEQLSQMSWNDAYVDGPFALDNAVSEVAAKHKGIQNPRAGHAHILMVPDIEAGNILYKSVAFLGQASVAAVIAGASVPVVLTSRADSDQSKFNSIALALAIL